MVLRQFWDRDPRVAMPILRSESKGCCANFGYEIEEILFQSGVETRKGAVPISGLKYMGCFAHFLGQIPRDAVPLLGQNEGALCQFWGHNIRGVVPILWSKI